MIGMRNRLIHNHAAVKLDVVWRTVQGKRPDLIVKLKSLVPPENQLDTET